jgi:hypothetical protein
MVRRCRTLLPPALRIPGLLSSAVPSLPLSVLIVLSSVITIESQDGPDELSPLVWEEPMKRLSLSPMLLLGLAACAPQAASPLVAAASPPGQGPSKNMGLNYEGTYVGVSVVNNSAGNTWTSGGSHPCVTEPAPILVISRGRAQFPWQGYALTGYVTPSGALMMTSTFGQVFEGSINSQHRITGQVTGYCSYDLTWQKQS